MKLILDEQCRIIGYTNDPLFKDFQAECEALPDESSDFLSDYKYIGGRFIYEPLQREAEEQSEVEGYKQALQDYPTQPRS
ncbi:hypothetical protein [Vibrio campbellii]|uniref:hypothetical protein n=1 Tax=Vibrio campbellii TaxID=680 RepID=UPI00210893C3|nr:hypothetical protein [Vibrio campbellii]UTZ44613.1 hypothetical protein HB764_25475 [Vibrio campbellii]